MNGSANNIHDPSGGQQRPEPAGEAAGLQPLHLLLVALGFAPLLILFFAGLWSRPHYQFFPMALAGAGFLAWTRCRGLSKPLTPGSRALAFLLLGSACILLALATVFWTPWLAGVAAIAALAGGVWGLGGLPLLRACTPALVLLLTIIPPPLKLDTDLTLGLRTLAVASSASVLDLLGVVLTTSANVIEIPGHKLLVEEACSGIHSVMFALCACLFYTLWQRRPPWRILLCLVATLAFVILGNVFRITMGAWLLFKFKWDLLSGWPHELVGLALTLAYLLLIWSLDRAITFLTAPLVEAPPKPSPVAVLAAESAPLPTPMTSPWGLAFGCAFLLVGVVGAGWGWPRHAPTGTVFPVASESALAKGAVFTLPETIGGWTRLAGDRPATRHIETMGIFSKIWRYEKAGRMAAVALDYPFRGFHDVSDCYRGAGWIIESHRPLGEGTASQPWLMEMLMEKDGIEQGYLLYGTVNEQGVWLALSGQGGGRLSARFAARDHTEGTTYRVQVLLTGYTPLLRHQQQEVRQLFEEVRRHLWDQLDRQLSRRR